MEEDVPTQQSYHRDIRIKELEDELNEKDELIEDFESKRNELKNQFSKLQIHL